MHQMKNNLVITSLMIITLMVGSWSDGESVLIAADHDHVQDLI